MDKYIPQIGDIILVDSSRFGAKCVKYFMRSPTIWHDVWRMIIGKLEKVNYYHVAMIINNGYSGFTGHGDIIEQQAKVQLDDWNPNSKQIIFRKINLSLEEQQKLKREALSDLKQGYDILNCFGKFLTWLTGMKFFARFIEWPKAEICINRIAHWYRVTKIDYFGVLYHSELTTHTLYKYLNNNYKIVYRKDVK